MGLLARLVAIEPVETWFTLELAAEERYWDAMVLAMSSENRQLGAIYLMGYSVEMALKVACYRLLGVPITNGVSSPGKVLATYGTVGWTGGNYHDLDAWRMLLENLRWSAVPALDPVVTGRIRHHVSVVATHWSESLRYKAAVALDAEVNEAFASTDWLIENREKLWRS